MTLPNLPTVDPGSDPDRFARELISRWFSPGWIDRVVRTWVPILLGTGLSWLSLHFQWAGLPEHPSTTFTLTATGVVIAVYYALASMVERRWPRIGRWLIALSLVRTQPVYAPLEAADAVEQIAYGAALRRSMS